MTRRFISTIVGAALAVTAIGNGPARADEDLARALAAIIGVAIVGKVISDKLDDNDDDRVTQSRVKDRYSYVQPRAKQVAPAIRRIEPRPLPRRADRRLLPGDCLRSFNTREGRYRVFGKNCLKKNYGFVKQLPRACEVNFRAKNNKKRRGYDARCLRGEGYQLARR